MGGSPFTQMKADPIMHKAHLKERWTGGLRGNKIPLTEEIALSLFGSLPPADRCFILGGGPSLKGFNFEILQREFTIGINRHYLFSNPSIHFAMDWDLYKEIKDTQEWEDYRGVKIFFDVSNRPYEDVYIILSAGAMGIPQSFEGGIFHGQNSGFGAIQLAYLLGFKEIYLLGFDMKMSGLEGHFSDKWYTRPQYEVILERFVEEFDQVAPMFEERGIRIVNLSPDTALECFTKKRIEEIL